MIEPPFSDNEEARLEALTQYEIVDTEPELIFDDFTQLAADICGTPIALISLIDESRQWFKSKVGLEATSTPRNISFCGHAILQDELLEVHNAAHDKRFSDNPLVTGNLNIRFYAGMPLTTKSGHNLGTICVIDTVSRTLTSKQRDALKRIARQVISQIENRANLKKIHQLNDLLNKEIRFIQNITDALPVYISYWDKNLICQFANATFRNLHGDKPTSTIGKSLKEVAPSHIFPLLHAHALKALCGQPQRFESARTFPTGVRHVIIDYVPEIMSDGSITGYYSVINDVTALKNAQKEQNLATSIFENISEGIMITDVNHLIVTISPSFGKMTGYTLDEVVGKTPRFLHPGNDDSKFKEIVNKLDRDKLWFGRMETLTKSGGKFFTNIRIDAVVGDDDQVTHYITSIVDYSKEHASEMELASVSNMLKRTGELAKVGGWELDIQTGQTKRSAEIIKILEIESGVKMTIEQGLDLFSNAVRSVMAENIQHCIEDGTPWDLVVPITTAKGRSIWIQSRGERICENGIPVKLVGAIQDITERKNEEIYRLTQENEHKNSLVREVHHRIKNNLQGITNLLFNFGVKYPELKEILLTAGTQIQSIAIIHGLQGSHIKTKVDLTHLLASIVKNAESVWQTQIAQNLLEQSSPIYLSEVESVPISLIVNELASNAIKHCTNKENIKIELIYDDNAIHAEIIITNEGQLSNSAVEKNEAIGGTGLKLIQALLPKKAVKFSLDQSGNHVITKLTLETPVIQK